MEWSFTISATTSQPSCKVVTTLQGCKHLAQVAMTLSQPYNVAARLLQPSYFHMGIYSSYIVEATIGIIYNVIYCHTINQS